MQTTLRKRHFSVWLDWDKAGAIEGIAREKGVDVGEVVQEILDGKTLDLKPKPVEENPGSFILLRVPNHIYEQFLKFFEDDSEMAKQSMLASIEIDGEGFAEAMGG